ncbi:hypothetical protein ACLOJK_014273 [Asimina triloba]
MFWQQFQIPVLPCLVADTTASNTGFGSANVNTTGPNSACPNSVASTGTTSISSISTELSIIITSIRSMRIRSIVRQRNLRHPIFAPISPRSNIQMLEYYTTLLMQPPTARQFNALTRRKSRLSLPLQRMALVTAVPPHSLSARADERLLPVPPHSLHARADERLLPVPPHSLPARADERLLPSDSASRPRHSSSPFFRLRHSSSSTHPTQSSSPFPAPSLVLLVKMGVSSNPLLQRQFDLIVAGDGREFPKVGIRSSLFRVLETFAKCGSIRDARKLFDEMPSRDGGTWDAMITSYSGRFES